MALSRKHYEKLAEIIQLANEDTAAWMEPRLVMQKLTDRMADYLAKDNPAFDRKRFYAAAKPRAGHSGE